MAIERISSRDLPAMRRAGAAAADTLRHIGERLAAGVSTKAIDAWVRAHTAAQGGTPSQLGYHGFPHSVCTSINEVVCHGMPSARVLAHGDIINVDVTTCLDGFHGDTSATFFIGEVSAEARHVVDVARRARELGVSLVAPGLRLGDLGAAIEDFVRANGCSSVSEVGGHGIGRKMHQDPSVPYVGPAARGLRLRPGMAITIEPMVNLGSDEVRVLSDGWTIVTVDGRLSAQFEHTVLVTETGHEVLTQ